MPRSRESKTRRNLLRNERRKSINKREIFVYEFSSSEITPQEIPKNADEIQFDDYYNYPLTKSSLPKRIRSIVFGEYFCRPIKDSFHDTVEKIFFGRFFDVDLDDGKRSFLPENLRYLSLGFHFSGSIDFIPDSIETLSLPYFYDRKVERLPKSLKTLYCSEIFFTVNKELIDSQNIKCDIEMCDDF